MSSRSADSKTSFATGENAHMIEAMYASYRQDPESVDTSWQHFFSGYELALGSGGRSNVGATSGDGEEACVEALINAYRRLGHLKANLDPIGFHTVTIAEDLNPTAHGLANVDNKKNFRPQNLVLKDGTATFPEILDLLEKTYSSYFGADYRELNDIEAVVWLQQQMESCKNNPMYSADLKKRIFKKLTQAEGFEKFLQDRFLGQKRFSVEGLDATIPMLDILADEAAKCGVEEINLGMAHRGRLNVLANFLGKEYGVIIKEFEGAEDPTVTGIEGDVKYHKGFAGSIQTFSGKPIDLFLCPNPSHLEAVNPVVEGFCRSRQLLRGKGKRDSILPIVVHGDAAVVGQGIVSETLNFMNLNGYSTGGTIHIIANNLIGFTANPDESKSCAYASDFAKIIRAPVFHVNADHPELAVWAAQLAVAFRNKYKRDVVIDLIGYRRHGHNETDEPAYTQPLLYDLVKKHPTCLKLYGDKLVKEGVLTENEVKEEMTSFRNVLQTTLEEVRAGSFKSKHSIPKTFEICTAYRKVSKDEMFNKEATSISKKVLVDLKDKVLNVPGDFSIHPKIQKLLEQRQAMFSGKGALDWGMAEILAYAASAVEGHHVRLTGQDCRRGTFSHRHAVLRDVKTGKTYESLMGLSKDQALVEVINSPLSEAACLGFEFGYSVAHPGALVIWEAQFGDFVNGAQIIIDQFLVASEAKWKQTSSLVMLLPHGYEGQGPEHSSARPERFLQACGDLNIQVANLTTPAQLFHALRRQVVRKYQKPLIIFTPKSLLRHPKVISEANEFTMGGFSEVLAQEGDPKKTEKLVFCTGKIYYDLLAKQEELGEKGSKVCLVRVEQLYPYPKLATGELFSKFKAAKSVIWVQEEPINMGAWFYMRPRLEELCQSGQKLKYVGRKGSGTTAEGSNKAHLREQGRIVAEVFE